jgi:hypothetical protein
MRLFCHPRSPSLFSSYVDAPTRLHTLLHSSSNTFAYFISIILIVVHSCTNALAYTGAHIKALASKLSVRGLGFRIGD